jgi:hypothetical protein
MTTFLTREKLLIPFVSAAKLLIAMTFAASDFRAKKE